jgi:hypothetical protein
MAPLMKRQRHSRTNQAKERRKRRKLETWRDYLDKLAVHKSMLQNNKGKSRTEDEYKMILLILISVLEDMVAAKDKTVSWTKVNQEVSKQC